MSFLGNSLSLSLSINIYIYIYIYVCVCVYEYHKREDMTYLRFIQGGFTYNVTIANVTNSKV